MAHNHVREPFTYSPNELAVFGLQREQTLAVARRLVAALGSGRRVALVTDGNEVDGLSAASPLTSDAASISLSLNSAHYALAGRGEIDRWAGLDLLGDADIVIAAGEMPREMTTIAVVDSEGKLLAADSPFGRSSADGTAAAYVLHEDASSELRKRARDLAGETPIYDARDMDSLASFALEMLEQRARSAPLYGLVLGGGRSERMHRDKAAIEYHGMPQVRFAYQLLGTHCDRVFVSNRADQAADPLFEGLDQIHDRFLGFGPMGGILSAFHSYPEAAWLVLGCDLPFVDEPVLRRLLDERAPLMLATCYTSAHDGLPEPLCAVYEPRYRRRLHQFLASQRDCPRKALINSRAKRIELENPQALDNINSPDELDAAMKQIKDGTANAK